MRRITLLYLGRKGAGNTYSIEMKASTSGRGTFEMEHSHYQELTGPLADKVIEERKALLGSGE